MNDLAESTSSGPRLEIREASGYRDFQAITTIRRTVFTHEQHLTDVVDQDPHDYGPNAVQILALVDDKPVGVGRLYVEKRVGHIAWVAILPAFRKRGVGLEIMDALLASAGQRGALAVTLSAQTHAIGFYQQLGFHTEGRVWTMSKIDHIKMVRYLDDDYGL